MSSKKIHISTIRSSAAEYLTFVAAGGASQASIEMRYEDENIWLTQKMMSTLYDVSVSAITVPLRNQTRIEMLQISYNIILIN
jgi:hypothetical protein